MPSNPVGCEPLTSVAQEQQEAREADVAKHDLLLSRKTKTKSQTAAVTYHVQDCTGETLVHLVYRGRMLHLTRNSPDKKDSIGEVFWKDERIYR